MTPHPAARLVPTPQLGVNDSTARVHRRIADGAAVRSGEVVCALETTKAVFEVESPADGFILYLSPADDEAATGAPLFSLHADAADLARARAALATPAAPLAATTDRAITAKARRLALSLDLDPAAIPAAGPILQTADVERYAASLQGAPPTARLSPDLIPLPSGGRPVVIYGAGRGGQTVLECLEAMPDYAPFVFVDDHPGQDAARFGLPLLPGADLPALRTRASCLALGVAGGRTRLRLLALAESLGFEVINVVSLHALIARSCELGRGLYIKSGTIIETATTIGDASIIDNGVTIAHHNQIGPGCHLAPGVSLGSGITLGPGVIVGVGASIASGVTLGEGAIVSPGSAVTGPVEPFSVVEGVPARRIGTSRGPG